MGLDRWLLLSVVVVGIVASLLLYSLDRYALLYYGDAVSHLVDSRKLVDWENPGLEQMGTVWLPLPHLLLLLPSLVDPLFVTGFAGTVVSLPSLAFTTLLLHRIINDRMILNTSMQGLRAINLLALLYALNPNMIYLGVVAMTETPFILFLVASIYCFQRWLLQGSRRYLLFCSLFISLATLCRYESWFIPILLLLVLIKYRVSPLTTLTAILISTSGIALWLVWNYYMFNDPLEFSNAEYYSAAWYAVHNQYHERYFMKPLNVMSVYLFNSTHVYGLLLFTGIAGFLLYYRSVNDKGRATVLLLILLLPPASTIVAMLMGVGEMDYVYNSRFTILLAPLLLVMTPIFLKRLSRFREQIYLTIIAAWNIILLLIGVSTYMDAYGGYSSIDTQLAIDVGEALRSYYDEGRIMTLTGSGLGHRIMITSGIALNRFDEMADYSTWKDSFKSPWLYDRWLMISKSPVHDATNVIIYWLEREDELLTHYEVVYENDNYKLMRLR